MKRVKHKLWISSIAAGMAGIMVVLFVYNTTTITAMAKETLPGVEKIVKNNAPDTPFKILEIVPEVGAGEIGLYIKGQEGFNLDADLKLLPTKAARTAYIHKLENNLSAVSVMDTVLPIPSPNRDSAPLFYEPYQEAYFHDLVAGDGWKKVDFSNEAIETIQTNGQYEAAPPGKKGDYTQKPAEYQPVEAGTGTHRENIIGFSLPNDGMPTPYQVEFSTTQSTDDRYKNLGTYEPIYQILDKELVASIKPTTTPIYTYTKENNTYTQSPYTIQNCLPSTPGGSPTINVDMKEYYYIAGYQYVDSANIQTGGSYYYVKSYTFAYDSTSGGYQSTAHYQALINPGGERYSPIDAADPNHKTDANFKSTGITYAYTPGTGAYNFKPLPGTESPVQVQVRGFYYKGGYTNNEWFKRHILDMDPITPEDKEKLERFKIEVTTVTPKQLHEKLYKKVEGGDELQSFDLIFLSGKPGETGKTYVKDKDPSINNDIEVGDANALVKMIASERTPLIMDWQVVYTDTTGLKADVNISKLGLIALQPDLPNYFTSFKSIDQINKTELDTLWNNRKNSAYTKNHLVNQNVYCFDGSKEKLVQNDLCKEIHDADSGAFQSVADVIKSENEYRESLVNKPPLDTTITRAAAIRHILNYKYGRNITPKTFFRILEIEPCANYNTDLKGKDKILTPEKILKWMGIKKPSQELIEHTTIERMTTAEFVGKIDDLNGMYDMIYIGMNTLWMNTKNGNTVYNDPDMNGLVYANVGDVTLGKSLLLGQLYSDYVNTNPNTDWTKTDLDTINNRYLFDSSFVGKLRTTKNNGKLEYIDEPVNMNIYPTWQSWKKVSTYPKNTGIFRYSGNDITKETRDKLLNYASAGYPIVFGNEFMNIDQKANKIISVNASKIDNSSYMYEFAQTAIQQAKDSKRNNLLTYGQLENSEQKMQDNFTFYMNVPKPKLTIELKGGALGTGENKNLYFLNKENNDYYLRYEFTITDEASLSPANTTYNCKLYLDINADGQFADGRGSEDKSARTEALPDILIQNTVNNSMMLPDSHGVYNLSAGVKYQLERIVPKGFRGALPWKLEILKNDISKEGIVAQRNAPIRGAEVGYACIKEEGTKPTIKVLQICPNNGNTFYLGTDPKQSTSTTEKFREYLESANLEFNIEIRTTTAASLGSTYEANTFKNLDMLIIGFADVFSEIDNSKGAVDGILEFIKSGKSVLFAHDTTSFVNTTERQRGINLEKGGLDRNMEINWGYNFNTKIRDIVGMDRYGISNPELQDLRAGKILKPTINKDLWDKIEKKEKDKAYVVGSNRTQTYPEVQGYTYQLLNTYKIDSKSNPKLSKQNLVDASGIKKPKVYDNMFATRVNTGQITTYPFEIPPIFQVSQTHNQYYQLDLNTDDDKDGKNDIVVWYCLGDAKSGSSPYSASPNDVRNNYYIYSNRNVMYTGVGHSMVREENEWEIKLFINTIVASYHTAVSAPRISVIENQDIRSAEVDNQYLTYEYNQTDPASGLDSSIDIYYKVADDNLVDEKKDMKVKYECLDSTGKPSTKELPPLDTYSMTTNCKVALGETLVGNTVYKVTLPDVSTLLGDQSDFKIKITLTSKFNNYGQPVERTAEDIVTISRSDLFDLE